MSEPAARYRTPGDFRDIDLGEMERRMRESLDQPMQQPPQRDNDPLAELARLVGSGEADPFRKLFAHREPEPGAPAATVHQLRPYEPQQAEDPYGYPQQQYDDRQYDAQQHYDPRYDQQAYEQGYAQDPNAQHYAQQAYDPAYGGQHYAQQDAPWIAQPELQPQYDDYAEEPVRRSSRAKLLLGAALLVVVGGIGGTLYMRSSGALTGEPPTILASANPVKVQPAQPESKGSEQSISVLERGVTPSTESKTVQSGEQPLDLVQATRGQGASKPSRSADTGAPVTLAPPAPPPVANSLFAEPKRVKAVQVRPDGSIVEIGGPAPAAAAPAPAAPAARPNDIAALVAATTPSSATPSAPKAPVRVEPKPVPISATPAAAKPAPAPTPAPTQLAATGGGFAVQLAGTTSEEEARDALTRLGRKFSSELGGLRPAIVRADVGSKTVYRVRVTNLSSDDANTLCARLKASGGSCFVAKN